MMWIASLNNIFKKEKPPPPPPPQIPKPRTTIECPVCNVSYPKEIIYCDICTRPLYGIAKCIKCRSSIAKRSAFCNICGKEQ